MMNTRSRTALTNIRELSVSALLTVIFVGLFIIIISHDRLLRTAVIVAAIGLIIALPLPRRTWKPLALALTFGFLIVAPFFLEKFEVDRLTDYAVYVMAAISLNMLIGMSGQISLGHGALLAIGGYAVGIMVQQHHVSFYLAALLGALLAAGVGFLLGLPAVRLTGPYLAIATLGLAISLPTIGKWVKVERWTKGSQGMEFSSRYLPNVPNWLQKIPGGRTLEVYEFRFFLTLAATALSALVVWNFGRSRTGRALVALRDSEPAAQVMGINLARYKILAFVVSAFIAGISGAFLSYELASVHPDTYGLDLSIAILAMIVIGGLNSILGSVLGAIFIRWLTLNKTSLPAPTDLPLLGALLPDKFKTFPTYAAGVYYGLLLILIMILMPKGLAGAYYRLLHYPYRERFFGRSGPHVPLEPAVTEAPFVLPASDNVHEEVTPS
ncbi:MAG: branched-chain amino acid ABC transporter permease [Dehalococcoidia bacterium]